MTGSITIDQVLLITKELFIEQLPYIIPMVVALFFIGFISSIISYKRKQLNSQIEYFKNNPNQPDVELF